MNKITIKVDGMMCSMCESHINDAVRNAFRVKKVRSSRRKGETVIVSEEEISAEELKKTIENLGYAVTAINAENA